MLDKCKYCNSSRFTTRRKGPHIGLYCAACGKWQRWLKQTAITGNHPAHTVVDDFKPNALPDDFKPNASPDDLSKYTLPDDFKPDALPDDVNDDTPPWEV